MRWRTALCLSIVAACATVGSSPRGGDARFERIAELEDARWDGDGELEKLAENADAAVRTRAATALGRLPFPEFGAAVTQSLMRLLFDPSADVRAAAAFALGMRGDASAADKLVFLALDHHQADPNPIVRARAIEALSKLDRPEFHERVLEALEDADPRVRIEAAQGTSRWSTSAPNAVAIDERLVAHLSDEATPKVVTYTLFALDRRKAKQARDVFLRYASSSDLEQRLYAVRGLKALSELAPAVVEAETDARILAEAAPALAARGDAHGLLSTLKLCSNKSASVRRSAWEALGAALERDSAAHSTLQDFGVETRCFGGPIEELDPSLWVRGAMYEAHFRSLKHGSDPTAALELLERTYSRHATQERIGLLRGVAALDDARAVPVLLECVKDPEFVVGETAIEMLGGRTDPRVRPALREMLAFENGLRLAAVTALAEKPTAEDVAPLVRCYETTHGDGTPEVRFNVLKALVKLGGDDAKALTRRALFDENAFVRRTARETYAELAKGDSDTAERLAQSLAARSPAELARRTDPLTTRAHARNPIVDVLTTRGTMTFELFPGEAPLHVENFLARSESSYYDGLTFHRVVPDFVIQGGCYRGDGNGGGTWRGAEDSLRHEITPRKYVRGSLGMPRYDDIDSGGSQFFVTHRSTPHLDGRYTIFGELRDGSDVLDAIEVGDVIVDVVVR